MRYRYIYKYKTGLTKVRTKLALALTALALGAGGIVGSVAIFGSAHAAPACTPTGFMRDSINLTAAQIGGNVKGTLDATGCNIGVYYDKHHSGNVSHADIFGANYFGVVVDAGQGNVSVNVQQSSVHDIGETPLNGTQHGVGIYYYALDTNGHATGKVSQNHVYNYQKGGIVINGDKANVPVTQNTVDGQGPVDYIAQNGIQFGYGSSGKATQNTVTGNAYTGQNDASSAGILIYGGCGGYPLVKNVKLEQNTVRNNDVGIYVFESNSSCDGGPASATNISVIRNIISDNAVTNVSGNDYPQGYQAGISDTGKNDKLTYNTISGNGYTPQTTTNIYSRPIDLSSKYVFSLTPALSHNTYDGHTTP